MNRQIVAFLVAEDIGYTTETNKGSTAMSANFAGRVTVVDNDVGLGRLLLSFNVSKLPYLLKNVPANTTFKVTLDWSEELHDQYHGDIYSSDLLKELEL